MVKGWDIRLVPASGEVEVELHHGPGCASWLVRLTQAQARELGAGLLHSTDELERRARRKHLGAHRASN